MVKPKSNACGWARATPSYTVPLEPPVPMPAVSLLDRFAEELSETGDIDAASTAIRVPLGVAHSLFERLCKRLESQAR